MDGVEGEPEDGPTVFAVPELLPGPEYDPTFRFCFRPTPLLVSLNSHTQTLIKKHKHTLQLPNIAQRQFNGIQFKQWKT
ncbi:hypothetical protein QL285_046814 [Trifolium repens]|jgi:hypothetical protein|nr:hypothetical protein QL285_046814 [Trifolium repens]